MGSDWRRSDKETDILLVEDDPRQCVEYEDFFDRLGLTHVIVNNGRKAIERLKDLRPKVVLLDIRLPGADGIEVAKTILARPHRPIVVLMSGHLDSVFEANQSSVKVFPVVEKPVDLRLLARFIREALTYDRG